MDKTKFTKYITIGWWLSFIFFVTQTIVINIFNLSATPFFGVVLFAAFVMLSFSSNYDKDYEYSPYKGLKGLFKAKG